MQIIEETLGQDFVDHFAFLPAQGTRRGAILVVHADNYKILQSEFRENTVAAKLQSTMSMCEWWITVVYGPQEDGNKLLFMNEMRQISTLTSNRWLVIEDFNMITRPQDKKCNTPGV
jgi:hypothetical protein